MLAPRLRGRMSGLSRGLAIDERPTSVCAPGGAPARFSYTRGSVWRSRRLRRGPSAACGRAQHVCQHGGGGSLGGSGWATVAGHLFWRNPSQALLGVYSSFTEWDTMGGAKAGNVAGEAALGFQFRAAVGVGWTRGRAALA